MFDLKDLSVSTCEKMMLTLYPVVTALNNPKATIFDVIVAMHSGDMRRVKITVELAKRKDTLLDKIYEIFTNYTKFKGSDLTSFSLKDHSGLALLFSKDAEVILSLFPTISEEELEDFIRESEITVEVLQSLFNGLRESLKLNERAEEFKERSASIKKKLSPRASCIFGNFANNLLRESRECSGVEFEKLSDELSSAFVDLFKKDSLPLKNGMRAIHPGEILKEEFLGEAGLSKEEIISKIDVTEKEMTAFLEGRILFDNNVLGKLAEAVETSHQFWINLTDSYVKARSEGR